MFSASLAAGRTQARQLHRGSNCRSVGPDQMPPSDCLKPFQKLTLLFCSCPHFCRGLNKSPTPAFRFSLRTHSFFEKIRKATEEICVQLLLRSRAQTAEVNEVAVSCKRIRSISMQKEQNPSNSHCYRGFCILVQAVCYSSVRSGESEMKPDAWCACLHINTRSVF